VELEVGSERRSSDKGGREGRKGDRADEEDNSGQKFADVAELFDATRPRTEWEKALVVGYWIMVGEKQADFASQDANTHLKHLGHGVANITDSLGKAMRQKPALVIQTAKSGAAKQARKKYKVTRAGMSYVEKMATRGDATED
jgi:hypothetical protein